MMSISIIFILFLTFSPLNSLIIGEPKIKCAQTGITIFMDHDQPFKGALFLKGSAERRSCKADFSMRPTQNLTFEFLFDDCPSRRKRQISKPRGLTMSSVLIVSYHGSIITHRDVAYQVDCFYREEHSQVHTLLNVSAPKPLMISDQPQLPICNYNVEVASGKSQAGIVTSSLTGSSPVVTVGESVVHVWTCSGDAPNDVYCMQVHSCMAGDGDSEQFQVVDDNGCTKDNELLSPIKYNGKSMRAAAASKAFKFADNPLIYFKCSIRLTTKTPGQECPINNCLTENQSGTIERNRRSIESLDLNASPDHPLIIFNSPQKPGDAMDLNILVTSPEMIVEPESAHNHLMSAYQPDMYSYKVEKLIGNENKGRSTMTTGLVTILIVSLVHFFKF